MLQTSVFNFQIWLLKHKKIIDDYEDILCENFNINVSIERKPKNEITANLGYENKLENMMINC